MKLEAKIILRNEVIIDEDIEVNEGASREEAQQIVDTMKESIKKCFREGSAYSFEFGDIIVNGKDISAVSLKLVEGDEGEKDDKWA